MFELSVLCAKVTLFNEVTRSTAMVYVPVEEAVLSEDMLEEAESIHACVATRVEFCVLRFSMSHRDRPERLELDGDRLRLNSGVLSRKVGEKIKPEVYFLAATLVRREELSPTKEGVPLELMDMLGVDELIRTVDGCFHRRTGQTVIVEAPAFT